MPLSMTGFARQEEQHTWGSISCEVRSVNHRYLEPWLRLPEVLRALEPEMREGLKQAVNRGKVEINFQVKLESSDAADLGVNQALVNQLIEASAALASQLPNVAQINPLELLKWPGVIQTKEVDAEDIKAAALNIFSAALAQLVANRKREGVELGHFIEQRLLAVGENVAQVRKRAPEIMLQYQEKLRAKLESLKAEVDEERFHQEVAYIAQKSDIAEELDRLDAHLTEVRHTLNQKGPVGRRLDFLMQELNREANTLSSKSMTSDTSQTAVDLKVLIEQMREQVQNIE